MVRNTYSCFSDSALAELVEVNEELLDSDPVFDDGGLEFLFNIQLHVHERLGVLLG
jgi:hypothetical protein